MTDVMSGVTALYRDTRTNKGRVDLGLDFRAQKSVNED